MSETPLFAIPEHKQICPLCQHELVMKSGKHGPFLGCSHYPHCHYIQNLHPHDSTVVKQLNDSPCPSCGSPLAVKNGRYGMFIGCSNFPACHFIVHEEAPEVADVSCPLCHKGKLLERTSKFGKTFYGCDQYPSCDFVLNFKPAPGSCRHCGFGLLAEKPSAQGVKLICASKKCQLPQAE
jgi:putative DNA topoisomerase